MGSHKDTKALSGVGIQGFGRQWLVKVIAGCRSDLRAPRTFVAEEMEPINEESRKAGMNEASGGAGWKMEDGRTGRSREIKDRKVSG